MEVQFEHHPQEELILAPGGFKHQCRVCKRGFGCGRALGGHMRAHGIVAGDQEADDDARGRRTYALRANPNRPKACQACDNCGMEFSSWKAFLDHHGMCSSSGGDNGNDGDGDDDGDSVLSCHDGEIDQYGCRAGAGGWSKLGKRSSRPRSVANSGSRSEEEVLANWLVMLSSSSSSVADQGLKAEPAEEEDREEEERRRSKSREGDTEKRTTASKAAFECKGCKKVFASHQALGGHRASHKTVKGCFAARPDHDGGGLPPSPGDDDDNNNSLHKAKSSDTEPKIRKQKMHECSICSRTFSSGQALGGHKRCHWITSAGTLDATTSPALSTKINTSHLQHPFFLQLHSDSIPVVVNTSSVPLDLNMPATKEGEPSSQIQYYNGIIRYKDSDDDDSGQVGVERRMKLAKLRDLRAAMEDVGGDAPPWLQMGIGSTAANVVVGADT